MILSVITNYIAFIKFSVKLPNWLFLFDIMSNFLSIYLSFAFAAKYYNWIFSSCHKQSSLYGCCAKLCYSCCSSNKKIKDEISLTINNVTTRKTPIQNSIEMGVIQRKSNIPTQSRSGITVPSATVTPAIEVDDLASIRSDSDGIGITPDVTTPGITTPNFNVLPSHTMTISTMNSNTMITTSIHEREPTTYFNP